MPEGAKKSENKKTPTIKEEEDHAMKCFKKYPWDKVTTKCRTCKYHVDCKKGTTKK